MMGGRSSGGDESGRVLGQLEFKDGIVCRPNVESCSNLGGLGPKSEPEQQHC